MRVLLFGVVIASAIVVSILLIALPIMVAWNWGLCSAVPRVRPISLQVAAAFSLPVWATWAGVNFEKYAKERK